MHELGALLFLWRVVLSRSQSLTESIDRLEGSRRAKRRLAKLLTMLAGECTTQDASRALGLGRTQLYDLRSRALQAAIDAIEQRSAGRPAKRHDCAAVARQLRDLQGQVRNLQRELELARARCLVAELFGVRPAKRP